MAITGAIQVDSSQVIDGNRLIELIRNIFPEMALRLTRQTEKIIFHNDTIFVIFNNATESKIYPDFTWVYNNWFNLLSLLEHYCKQKIKLYITSYTPFYEYTFSFEDEKKIFKIDQGIPVRMSKKTINDIKIGSHPYPFVVMQYFPLSASAEKDSYLNDSFDAKYKFFMKKSYYVDDKFKVIESNLPYGGPARSILSGIFSIAKITNSPVVFLGKNKNDTCRIFNLDTKGSGGKKPLEKLLDIGFSYLRLYKMNGNNGKSYKIFEKYFPWWQKREFYSGRNGSYIILNREFFDEFILPGTVPSDFKSYMSMKRCPLGMDIYVWLNFRMNKFPKNTAEIMMPVKDLMKQFATKECDIHSFKKGFNRALYNYIYKFWPELRSEEAIVFVMEDSDHFLKIKKIDPHVKPLV